MHVMRILHFVSSPDVGSGVMSVIMNYYKHIDRNRIQFDFVYFIEPAETSSYVTTISQLGGKTYRISKPGASIESIEKLFSFFRRNAGQYMCLHNHEVYLSWILRPLSRYYGIKYFLVHCHATCFSDKKIAALRNRILCTPIQRMRNIQRVACSEAAADFLYRKKTDRSYPVIILPNAIEVSRYQFSKRSRNEFRKVLGIAGNELILGHIGRLVPQKNQEFLLTLVWYLNQMIKKGNCAQYIDAMNIKLLIIGAGALQERLRRRTKELRLESQVIFVGEVNNVVDYLNIMDVFLLPSLYEGLPMSLLEAQANGLPCLISDRITLEGVLSNNVQRLPLHVNDWCDILVKMINDYNQGVSLRNPQEEVSKAFGESCYNIMTATRILEKYYMGLRKERKEC